jgi:hypothetical protein
MDHPNVAKVFDAGENITARTVVAAKMIMS